MKKIINTWGLLRITGSKLVCLFSVLLILNSCKDDPFSFQEPTRQVLMLEMLKQDTSLSIAVAALEKAKIASLLSTYGPFTFFVPDNNAFRKYFKASGKASLDDFSEEELKTLMVYHILQARLKAAEFIQGPQVPTTGYKDYITIDISKGFKTTATANGKALIYETDIEYSNGYVHKMDAVLDPPTLTIGQFLLANKDQYSIMIGGLERAGLMDTLTDLENSSGERIRLTLFAETNDVLQKAGITTFDNMPLDELKWQMKYHILRGSDFSSSYTLLTPALAHVNIQESWAKTIISLNGQDYIHFDLAGKKLINNETIDFAASDIIMRNGVVHNVDSRLFFSPELRRTQIFHWFKLKSNYAYGVRLVPSGTRAQNTHVGSGDFRISNDGNDVFNGITRNQIQILFANGEVGDSVVTVVEGIRKGKYQFEVRFKGGNRGTAQMMHKEDKIGIPVHYTNDATSIRNNGTYASKIIGTYTFDTSGDKRIKWVWTASAGIAFESMTLTPVYN